MDLWVLIYSKFSLNCQQLQSYITESGLDIPFTMICIDDKDMRKRIMDNKDFNIKYVPTILQINQMTGVVSQYEADKAFELISGIVQSFVAEEEEQERTIEQPIVHQPRSQVEHTTDINEEADNETIIPQKVNTTQHTTQLLDLDRDFQKAMDSRSDVPALPSNTMPDINPIKKRIRASDVLAKADKDYPKQVVMPSYSSSGIDLTAGPPPPIKSVKSGAPINISEVMARAAQSNDS